MPADRLPPGVEGGPNAIGFPYCRPGGPAAASKLRLGSPRRATRRFDPGWRRPGCAPLPEVFAACCCSDDLAVRVIASVTHEDGGTASPLADCVMCAGCQDGAMSGPPPPRGTVTFLFSDIEGSTDLVRRLGDDVFAAVRADHRRLLRPAFQAHRGREIDTAGDSFFVAFGSARSAVAAAVTAQRALGAFAWPADAEVLGSDGTAHRRALSRRRWLPGDRRASRGAHLRRRSRRSDSDLERDRGNHRRRGNFRGRTAGPWAGIA